MEDTGKETKNQVKRDAEEAHRETRSEQRRQRDPEERQWRQREGSSASCPLSDEGVAR